MTGITDLSFVLIILTGGHFPFDHHRYDSTDVLDQGHQVGIIPKANAK